MLITWQVEMAVYAHRTEEWSEQRFGYTPKLWRMESALSEWSPDWVSVVEIGPHPTASGSEGLRNPSWRTEFKCWQCGEAMSTTAFSLQRFAAWSLLSYRDCSYGVYLTCLLDPDVYHKLCLFICPHAALCNKQTELLGVAVSPSERSDNHTALCPCVGLSIIF